jgi:hypothetical protein
MKRFINPQIIVVGATVVALVALSTVVSAAGANHQSQLTARGSGLQVKASPEPEHQNEAVERNELPEKPENEEQVAVPPPAPAVSTRTFALVGGTVTFRCTGNVISLVSATPNSGFRVEAKTEAEHGRQQIEVEFESATHESEIKASCVGGEVQANEIKEESESHSESH